MIKKTVKKKTLWMRGALPATRMIKKALNKKTANKKTARTKTVIKKTMNIDKCLGKPFIWVCD